MSADQKPFFELCVEDIFSITGRGTIVTGTVSKGAVRKGDVLYLKKPSGESKQVTILAIEGFRKVLKEALMGESVGLTIDVIDRNDISRGDIITFSA
ncbi:EF-Tu/IF-2/RF-3 family GTPase [Geminisphaera colitermitum]|uniref:EF-Tu/IF-2/RF-3 family GTPase n=1 Tax=Geminisphaera colitermitum TaxID=1148786 RepID=UPI00019652CC|nr:EF-Tu/IF-2/RF-3 family GTPase [Geminisphaera colitermitum]